MPNSKSHDSITFMTSIIIFCTSLMFVPIIYSIIWLLFYLFAGYMFNGDLDIHSKPYTRWGFLRFIWIPYQRIFKHRSKYTHGFLIGTLIRLIWILIIPILIVFFFKIPVLFLIIQFKFYIITSLIGLEMGAMSHSIADWVS